MKTLRIQFQPDLAPELSLASAQTLFESIEKNPLVFSFSATENQDKGSPYINFDFATENMPKLWSEIWRKLYTQSPQSALLRKASIVVCEGSNSWHNYLLLHHFDPNVSLNGASEL